MKKALIGLSLVAFFGGQATVALAADGEKAFKANCNACHGTGVGPKPAEIAAAYKGDKAALKTFLTTKGTAAKVSAFASKAATMQAQLGGPVAKVEKAGELDAVVDYLISAK